MAVKWTEAQREAWQYARAGIAAGTPTSLALAEYRAGGGHIRDADWYSLYKGALQAAYVGEWATKLPDSYTISRDIIQPVDIRYQEKFQVHVKVTVRDAAGNVYPETYRIVQSDKVLTLGEWKNAIRESVQADRTIPGVTEIEIESFQFTERM